jgi:hypothetical protein
MPCIGKQAFLQPLGLVREKYPLPDYGPEAYVVVRSLTALDLTALDSKHGKGPKDSEQNLGYTYDLLARALVDDADAPLFVDGEDVRAGLNVTINEFRKLVDKVLELSKLDAAPKN